MLLESGSTADARPSAYLLLALVVLGVFVVDQATKAWVLAALPLYSQKEIISGFFNLVHVRNTGVAFSFFAGSESPWRVYGLSGLTFMALVVIFFLYRQTGSEEKARRVALGLIAGGALGNVVDRLRFGNVVDFLDFYIGPYHWPAFNVADMAVTTGAALLLFTVLRTEKKTHPPFEKNPASSSTKT